MIFENRQEAGKRLAGELLKYSRENPYILSLPRGGVPIGFEVAEVLHAPLDVVVVRKIGLSGNKEFGIGAIAEGGVRILDQTALEALGVDRNKVEDAVAFEEKELQRRVEAYRGGEKLPNLKDKTVILVDDGMATGVTARAAIEAVKKFNPKKVILALPVCALDAVESLKAKVEDVVCLFTPYQFMAVGSWYKHFEQLSDEEVVNILKNAKEKYEKSKSETTL